MAMDVIPLKPGDLTPAMKRNMLIQAKAIFPDAKGGEVTLQKRVDEDGQMDTTVRIQYPDGRYISVGSHRLDKDDKTPYTTIDTGVKGANGKDVLKTSIDNNTSNGAWNPDSVTGLDADKKVIQAGTRILGELSAPVKTPQPKR